MAKASTDPPPQAADAPEVDLDAGSREHYLDAALYDHEYRRRRADVNWYRELAARLAPGGPILELGCGSGRVLTALARDGHRVVGLDLSAPMLARAAERSERLGRAARARVRLVRGDMRRFAFAARFPLIICPFNALQHLYARLDIDAALACVRAGLAPGGRFAFDVLFPDLRWLSRDPERRWSRTVFTNPADGRRTRYTTNQRYDPVTQIADVRIYYQPLDEHGAEDGRERVVRLCQRQFFPAELNALCAHAGLPLEEAWGGFAGEPLDGAAVAQVLVTRRAPDGD